MLLSNHIAYPHILRQILLSLDSRSLRSLRCTSGEIKEIVDDLVWSGNATATSRLKAKLRNK